MGDCPKCGATWIDISDRHGRYYEHCYKCKYTLDIKKADARKKFKCKKCVSMRKLTIDTDERLAFQCFDCGYEETFLIKQELNPVEKLLREKYRKGESLYTAEEQKKLDDLDRRMAEKREKEEASQLDASLVHCPKCNSTQITAGQRGYSIISGWWGSGATMNRCANCGHRWRPKAK